MAKETPLETPQAPQDKKKADRVKKYLQAGQNYKTSRNFYEEWAEYQRFWEADQWPAAKPGTETFPRPVTNHFAEIIDMKVAGMTYERPGLYFEPKKGSLKDNFDVPVIPVDTEEVEDGEDLTVSAGELLTTISEDVADQNDIENILESFTRSSALLGNGILYCYWDNSIEGIGEGAYIGEIGIMEIDIADFYVGDPKEPDVQKQPYIIVTERRPLEQVKKDYDRYSDQAKSLRATDPQSTRTRTYDHEKVEQDEADYVDLMHFWEKETVEEKVGYGDDKFTRRRLQVNYMVVCQTYVLREEKDFHPNKKYPFVNFIWMPRRKSFYGKPESVDLINNQKELNRLQGIALLGAYKTGLPNVVFKKDFVKKEDIPVGPGGQVIEDRSPPGQGWGVDYLQPPTIASYIPLLRDSMSQGMKDASGVHEAWSGKAPSAHLNASAIMALQEAAGVRIRGIQRRYYAAVRDLGDLFLGYIMKYYTENRLFKVYAKKNIEGKAWFELDKFQSLNFEPKVTKGSASPYAKTVIASTLERMLELGAIDPELYLQMLPPEVFPKVIELLELKQDRKDENRQVALEQQKAVVDEVVSQVVSKAQEEGVEITPEALQEMRQLISDEAEEEGL